MGDSGIRGITPEEIRDALLVLPDGERKVVITRPIAGQGKIYAVQTYGDVETNELVFEYELAG